MSASRSVGIHSSLGLAITESDVLTVIRPHILSTERTLARVAGGPWMPRFETIPDPKFYQLSDGRLYAHPATVAALKAKMDAGA